MVEQKDNIYRIGSFNLHNIGMSAFTNERNLEKIAEIIKDEALDIVALQEVLSEGKIFSKDDVPSRSKKKDLLTYLGGNNSWGFEWAYSGDESNRHEGYAFLWNRKRVGLATAEVVRYGKKTQRHYIPRMIKVNRSDMKRQPFFARFVPNNSNFEIRLLCVHTYYGDDTAEDRMIRQHELDVLMKEIYPQIADKNFQNAYPRYTILLGDYNAELVTDDKRQAIIERNAYRRSQNTKIPMFMKTDGNGCVESELYGVKIKTTQDQLTTLKLKNPDSTDEKFEERGYASNYDHFSYDEDAIGDVINKDNKPQRIDLVRKYYNDDFEKYYKEISDHIPIVIELKI